MREDGDNSAQSEQMLSALALVLHNTQSTLVLGVYSMVLAHTIIVYRIVPGMR